MTTAKPIAYTTGGTVQASGGLYIARKADSELLQACREGIFAYVLTARQIGKSSLMTRTAQQLRSEGIQAVIVDLQTIGVQVTAEQWYLGILAEIEGQLMLDTDVIDWWMNHAHLGFTQRFTQFFGQVLLKEVPDQIVVFVDEIDTVLSLDFTDDFFIAIRYFQVNRAQQPEFERLSFVLLGVATPTDLIRDRQRTPFNIGQQIELTDFTPEEARPFARGFQLPETEAEQVLDWVLEWTGGHPYLTQRLCQTLVERQQQHWTKEEIKQVVQDTFLGDRSQQDNNLQFVRDMLLRRSPDVMAGLTTYRDTWRNKIVEDENQSLIKSHLKLSGVVKREGTILKVRNFIYRQAFNVDWVREHLPETWWQRLKPAMPLLATMLVAMVGITLTTFALQQQRLAEERSQANLVLRLSKLIQNERLQGRFSPTTTLLAIETLQRLFKSDSDSDDAYEVLRSALRVTPQSVGLPITHRDWVYDVAFSPDGKYLATASRDKTARISETFTGKEIVSIQHQDTVYAVTFSPDGKYIVTASRDKTARISETQTGKQVAEIRHDANVYWIDFSPDGKYVATASADKTARISEALTGKEIVRFPYQEAVTGVAFSSNGKYLATAGTDKTARIIEISTRKEFRRINYPTSLSSIAFSPNDRYIAMAVDDSTVRIVEVQAGKELRQIPHQKQVTAIAFSQDGQYIATASQDKKVRISEMSTGREVARITHQDEVWGVDFSPGGDYIATASRDRTVRVSETAIEMNKLQITHQAAVNGVAFSPDAQYLATASDDQTARITKVLTGEQVSSIEHPDKVSHIAFSSNGRYVATATGDKTVRISDAFTGKLVFPVIGHQGPVQAIAFSPDGHYLATTDDKTALITDTRTGKQIRTISHQDRIKGVTFSGDSTLIGTASYDKTVRITEILTGKLVEQIQHPDKVDDVTFSPNGQYVATAGADRKVHITEFSTGQETTPILHQDWINDVEFSRDGQHIGSASDDKTARISEITGRQVVSVVHEDVVQTIVFSLDSHYLATASADNTAHLIETKTGKQVGRISHQNKVKVVAFSSNGKYLATASEDGTAQLSWVKPEDLIAAACRLVSTNLSKAEWKRYFGNEPYRETCSGLPPAPDTQSAITRSHTNLIANTADKIGVQVWKPWLEATSPHPHLKEPT